MTDDELVERVARSICHETGRDPGKPVQTRERRSVRVGNTITQDFVTYPTWHDFREEARKHIAAWKVLRAVLPIPYPEEVMPELPLTPD
ncbi:hypothetical protein [Shinella sp.]|uniref:hypothetical protein n=1 Tax=Shinella sp. TaxID=1870904 RepID=UPI0029B2537A|nr:hypothetical protein [Shinella sp.]MDX3976141.1 hypothetical protein [Shinella sp.]